MVVNPITITPERYAGRGPGADAAPQDQRHPGGRGKRQALIGILTNRDVRFAGNPRQPVAELMSLRENLATVAPGCHRQEEARRLLHQRRIEKLLVVDDAHRCIGLITVKDIEKAVTYPNATKDATGRLRVAAATTVGDKVFRANRGFAFGRCWN